MRPRTESLSVLVSIVVATLIGVSPTNVSSQTETRSAIAFTSTRDNPADPVHASELYLMLTTPAGAPDPTQTFRLTQNATAEGFAALSPDGKRIVFDSNRLTDTSKANSSDLFVMSAEDFDHPIPDQEQKHLTRGSSASWAPHGQRIAFHASQSGNGRPLTGNAGSETSDSDIFTMNVNDCLEVIERNHVTDCREVAGPHMKNITDNGSATIDDDPDWSPDGRKIVYVRHAAQTTNQFAPDAEIYLMTVDPDGTPVQDGTENPRRLTSNSDPRFPETEIEERGPAWSPDGQHIAYACRLGVRPPGPGPNQMGNTFKICVMDADGNNQITLTTGTSEFTPTWSPDGKQIMYHSGNNPSQLFVLDLRFDQNGAITGGGTPQQLTSGSGANGIASWGQVRTK